MVETMRNLGAYAMSGTGKWAQIGVPHKGWSCVGFEDLGSLATVCEMCELQEIRYVHYMKHPDYRETLGVGCICAENMELDYTHARKREREARNKSARRRRWLSRKWKVSARGNSFLNSDGYNIVAFRRGAGWSFRISDRSTEWSAPSRRIFATKDEAKLAAFDAMIFLKNREGR